MVRVALSYTMSWMKDTQSNSPTRSHDVRHVHAGVRCCMHASKRCAVAGRTASYTAWRWSRASARLILSRCVYMRCVARNQRRLGVVVGVGLHDEEVVREFVLFVVKHASYELGEYELGESADGRGGGGRGVGDVEGEIVLERTWKTVWERSTTTPTSRARISGRVGCTSAGCIADAWCRCPWCTS